MLYKITKADLIGKFPFSKVLQTKYGSSEAYNYSRERIKILCRNYKKSLVEFDVVISLIMLVVVEARRLYPEDFTDWWDKKELKINTIR